MKKFLAIFSLSITLVFLSLHSHIGIVHAQIFVEGWFCDNTRNAIMHEVFPANLNEPPVISIWEDCGANEVCTPIPPVSSVHSRDASCFPTGNPPAQGSGANMHANPGTVTPGGAITLAVTSDRDVGDQCYNEININSLRTSGRLTCTAGTTDCGCQTKHVQTCNQVCDNSVVPPQCHQECNCDNVVACGPGDWPAGTVNECGEATGVNPYDNRQCFTNFTCTAGNSTGSMDVRFDSPTPACDTHVSLSVSSPGGGQAPPTHDSCIPGTYNVNAPNGAPVSRDRITEDSMSDDLENAQRLAVLNPDSVNTDIQTVADSNNAIEDPVTHAPVTGVDDVVRNFTCSARGGVFGGLAQAIIAVLGLICPEPVITVNNSLDQIAITTEVEANSTSPEGARLSQAQDCAVSDVQGTGGVRSDGDAKMRLYSASMGGEERSL